MTNATSLPDDELPNRLSNVEDRQAQVRANDQRANNIWRSNYHEASIYIEEGLNNDKFENHPKRRNHHHPELAIQSSSSNDSVSPEKDCNQTTPLISCAQQQIYYTKPTNGSRKNAATSFLLSGQYTTIETYILVHNRYFYQLDLVASLVLLFLALFERPAVPGFQLDSNSHLTIELVALAVIAMELILKFRWMGPRRFFHHGRTVLKILVLIIMIIEAAVIFSRQAGHARYSRALRPIFLIDNHYCKGIRRAIRQIFQSLPPILDMFTLMLFFMFVFSVFGFYLLAAHSPYFSTMTSTLGHLVLLSTTANLPDVMLPSYGANKWTMIYFVMFVIIHMFLLTNLTSAAVYESFTRKEKEKFHKLLLHRRKACQEAFKLLVSRKQPNRIQYKQFMGLMRYLKRKCSMFDAYLTFKALDTDKNGTISLEEFYQIYDFINLDWKLVYPEVSWFEARTGIAFKMESFLKYIQRIYRHPLFEWVVDFTIIAMAVLQFLEATTFEFPRKNDSIESDELKPDSISTSIFVSLFLCETIIRCLALGLSEYWANNWHKFDLLVLIMSILGIIFYHVFQSPFAWVIVLRVLRLIKRFEFKKRYKDMWQTLVYILLKRFVSMTCVVLVQYYFFAIVGMELLSEYQIKDCCKNTSMAASFTTDPNGSMYYTFTFDDVISSYLALFGMSSQTYWLTMMNGYAYVANTEWVRIYFALYYLCSIIVMNIVIAFILESFLFRIHYRSKMGDNCDDANLFTVRVVVSSNEVDQLYNNVKITKNDENLAIMFRAVQSKKQQQHREEQEGRPKSPSCDDEEAKLIHSKRPQEPTKQPRSTRLSRGQKRLNSHDVDLLVNLSKAKVKFQQSQVEHDQENPQQAAEAKRPATSLFDGRYYFIFQAAQIRNKFSFTMKMYADEVEEWLAEAERADQDEVSLMISRNQLRAEHVAMARLVRRNMAAASANRSGSLVWTRARSYSSSGNQMRPDVDG